MRPTLAIRDLVVQYGRAVAVSGVDLTAAAGTTVAVIGPNGSGKSTLLKAIAGIVAPSSGTIDIAGPTPAFVLQSTDVDSAVPITVRDTVAMARYPSRGLLRRFRPVDREAVRAAMTRLDITDLADRQLHDLSGGQRQRVLVAQGLAQESTLLLLDEPVNGLDLVSRGAIMGAIDDECTAGRTVILTTHSLEDARRCDQVVLLAKRMIAAGPPDEVLREAHLHEAFGGRFIRVGDELVLDDPHHVH